jgi:hypothetical protein
VTTLRARRSSDTQGEVSKILARLESAGQDNAVLTLVANSDVVFKPFVAMASALNFKGTVSAETREILILWLAATRDVPYEWAEHERVSRRLDISNEQRAALRSGSLDAAEFTHEQLIAIDLARSLLAAESDVQARWEAVVSAYGPGAALEVLFVTGFYGGMVPMVLSALGLGYADSADGREAAASAG